MNICKNKNLLILIKLLFVISVLFFIFIGIKVLYEKENTNSEGLLYREVDESILDSFQNSLQNHYDALDLLGGKDNTSFYLVTTDPMVAIQNNEIMKVFGFVKLTDFTFYSDEKMIRNNGGGITPCAVEYVSVESNNYVETKLTMLSEGDYKECLRSLCVDSEGNKLSDVYDILLNKETKLDSKYEKQIDFYIVSNYGNYKVIRENGVIAYLINLE